MPGKLRRGLEAAGIPNATAIARDVYRQPLTFVKTNPPGSPAREAVTNAYRDVQRLLAIIGICISAVALPLALFMENITLTDERSLVERDDVSETSSVEREKEKGDAVEVDPGYVQDNKARPVV
jgi:SIT family siderophore-iron:H+ symporter-like MFS transporter